MSTLALVRHRWALLVVVLFWIVLPTPSYERPVSMLVDGLIADDDSAVPEIPWDPSPAIPTARFEAATTTTDALVEVRPPSPIVGETVQVRLTTLDREGGQVSGFVHFGTARSRLGPTSVHCIAPERRRRTPDEPRPVQESDVSEHVFHSPGRHRMEAALQIVDCDSRAELVVTGQVDVRPGTSKPNVQPIVGAVIDVLQEPPGHWFAEHLITVRVTDPDGSLHHAHVDFGDGTEAETFGREHGWICRDTPARQLGAFDSSTSGRHVFSSLGQFTIRAVVTTTGCDGTNPQTTTVTRTLTLQ